MSAPLLVSYTASTFSGGPTIDNKVVTGVSVLAGDLLVVLPVSEDYTAAKVADVSSGSEVWAIQEAVEIAGNSTAYGFTATAVATATLSITVSLVDQSPSAWGFGVFVFRGHGGVGATNSDTGDGAPLLSLTTLGDSSAVAVASADWNSVDGSTRTWRAGITGKDYFRDAAAYAAYMGLAADTLSAGIKTEGLTAPTGQHYSIVAIEVLGSGGGGPAVPVANAGPDQAGIEPGATVTLTGSGTNSPTGYTWTQTGGTPVTLSDPNAAAPTFTAPSQVGGATLTFSLVASNAGGSSAPDTVSITVLGTEPPPPAGGSPVVTFVAPYNSDGAVLTFSLVASNGSGDSIPDSVTVGVLPQLDWLLEQAGWVPMADTLF